MRLALLCATLSLSACARLPATVAEEMSSAPSERNHYARGLGDAVGLDGAAGVHGVVAGGDPARSTRRSQEVATDSAVSADAINALRVTEGQIVVSEQGGGDSLFVSLMAEEYQPFVHAGIVAFDDGEPYVYEQRATLRPYLAGPPTRSMGGKVRRVPLAKFLARHRIVALYDPPPGTDGAAVASFARKQLERRTPFDPYFNLSDSGAMYCTEFVALALEAGGARIERVPLTSNRSVGVVLDWLGIHTERIITAGSLTRDAHQVALLSRGNTPAQLATYFELKRELHRRFTAEQKLGNALRWSWSGLKLREDVRAYVRAGLDAARDAPPASDAERAAMARALALQVLGPQDGEQQTAGQGPIHSDGVVMPAPHTSLR